MLGVDIYDRYQDVTDWAALARTARWAWIKASDGGGRAAVAADGFVREALRAGLPVGLYHYAQLSPSPEAQADVLAAEVRRLGADQVAPALDLEDPFVPGRAARAFAERFCRRLRAHFPRVAVYGNTTMLASIRPDQWDIDGLVIWAADYGANLGQRNPDLRPYTGRVDVHQYTSRGRIAGIPGHVDLNHAHTTRHLLIEEDDMQLSDRLPPIKLADGREYTLTVADVFHGMAQYIGGNGTPVKPLTAHPMGQYVSRVLATDAISVKLDAVSGQLTEGEATVLAALRAREGLTPEQYAEILADQLDDAMLAALLTLAAQRRSDTEEAEPA